MTQSMNNTYVKNKWFDNIPTHIIIWCNGDVNVVNDLNDTVWATLSKEANEYWIHIEVVGEFNKHKPSIIQYVVLKNIIEEIELNNWKLEIKWHSDFQKKNCPWKYFNFDFIKWYDL